MHIGQNEDEFFGWSVSDGGDVNGNDGEIVL